MKKQKETADSCKIEFLRMRERISNKVQEREWKKHQTVRSKIIEERDRGGEGESEGKKRK